MWHIIVKKLKALPIIVLKMIFPPLAVIPTKLLMMFMPEKADGSENVGVTMFASKMKKFLIIAIVIGVICGIVWLVLSFSMFFMLDEEGIFADLNNGKDITIPDTGETGPQVGFDDVTSLISKIDMNALRDYKDEDGNPITISGLLGSDSIPTMLYSDTMSPYTYLMLYQLGGEICLDPLINPSDAPDKMTPGLLMGVLKHENGWDFGLPHKETAEFDLRKVNPYTAWNTRLGYGTIPGWTGVPRHLATLFGTSQMVFREHTAGLADNSTTSGSGVALPVGVPSFSGANNIPHQIGPSKVVNIDGAGQPVLFISQVENPNYTGPRAVLAVNDSANLTSTYSVDVVQLTPEVKKELKYLQHEYLPWSEVSTHGGIAAQRPSGTFMPDAMATTAYTFRLTIDNRDTGTGYPAGSAQAAMYEGSIASKDGLAKRYAEVSGWFSIRASKTGFYAADGPGSEVVDDIIARDLVKKFTTAGYYEANGGNVSSMLDKLHVTLRDPSFADGFSPNVLSAVTDYLSQSSGEEWIRQATDGLYLLICEQSIHDTALAIATAAHTKFPLANAGDGNAGYVSTAGWGGNPMDKDFDGLCDDCGESVFETGSDHVASSKLYWPSDLFSVNFLNSCGYHALGGCSTHNALGFSHFAYDIPSNRTETFAYCKNNTILDTRIGGNLYAVTSGLAVPRNIENKVSFTGATSNIGSFGTSITLYVTDKAPAAGEEITPEFILANTTYTIQYAHLSRIDAQFKDHPEGLIVKAGTTLGLAGGTNGQHTEDGSHVMVGNKSYKEPFGEHLHLEIHRGNLEVAATTQDKAVDYIPKGTKKSEGKYVITASPGLVMALNISGTLIQTPYILVGGNTGE